MVWTVGDKLGLHGEPETFVDDRRVGVLVEPVFVADGAAINRVGQQVIDRATAEGPAADQLALAIDPSFGSDPPRLQIGCQDKDRVQVEISLEDVADGLSLGRS